MSSVLTWLVRKGSACGDLYTLLFTAKIAAQKGRAVSFLTLFCIPCLDSLWLCMPCLVRAPCGFADTKRYLLPIQKKKSPISRKEHQSVGVRDTCCLQCFPSFNGLVVFLLYPVNRGCHFFLLWVLEGQGTLSSPSIQLPGEFMFLLHIPSLNNCGFKHKPYEFREGRNCVFLSACQVILAQCPAHR